MAHKREKSSKKLQKQIKEFGDSSTIHGLAYVFGSLSGIFFERVIWAVVFIAANVFAAFLISSLIDQWNDSPVTTTVNSVNKPISEIPFPAIAVCKSGASISRNIKRTLEQLFSDYVSDDDEKNKLLLTQKLQGWDLSKNITILDFLRFMNTRINTFMDLSILQKKNLDIIDDFLDTTKYGKNTLMMDFFIDPELKDNLDELRTKTREQVTDSYGFLDDVLKNENNTQLLYELLWNSGADPCEEVIKYCELQGMKIPCEQLFHLMPTKLGPCCAFNMQVDIYQESPFKDAVMAISDEVNHTLTEGLVNKAGLSGGLKLLMDLQTSSADVATINEDHQGFKVGVFLPDQFSNMETSMFTIAPGHDSFITLDALALGVDKDLGTMRPSERNCYFPNEYELINYNSYSYSNCMQDCISEITFEKFGCSLWQKSSIHSKICNPTEASRVVQFEMNLNTAKLCPQCLSDCQTAIMKSKLSQVPFRRCDERNIGLSFLCTLDQDLGVPPKWGDIAIREFKMSQQDPKNFLFDSLRSHPSDSIFPRALSSLNYSRYDPYKEDIALLHIYFESDTIIEYSRKQTMTTIDFISQMGGILGLCLGFSLVSLFELIFCLVCSGARLIKN